ncbi:hypothetical protein OAA91_00580 [Fibrobacterales bacterium]|nr:hypothetical protein [Fibrobacterales bacterium]
MQLHLVLYTCIPPILLYLVFYFHKKHKSNQGRKHQSKGILAEENALRTLQKQGFKLLDRNPKATHFISISRKIHTIYATPDLLMKRGRKKWVFEVKSQNSANIHKASVRRQLREYGALYPKHNLAFFDANTNEWEEIVFPEKTLKSHRIKRYLLFGTALCMGALLDRYLFSNYF